MKPPEIVNATQTELDELLTKAKPTFTPAQYLGLTRFTGSTAPQTPTPSFEGWTCK